MESVDAKIIRAHEHLDTLNREIKQFYEATKHNFALKANPEQTEAWLTYWVDDDIPPIRFSAVVGDCLFNMRSALDNLVCGMVRVHAPGDTCAGRSFPICVDPTKFDQSLLRGVPADAVTLIKHLQPYQRPQESIAIDPLNILNTLCNRDKHRAANLTSGYSKNAHFRIHAASGPVDFVVAAPLRSGQTIPVPVAPSAIAAEVKVEARATAVIAFRDAGPWGERPVTEVLIACLDYVENRVIARFKPFFR